MPSEKFEQGLNVRREVLGDEYVDAALSNVDDFNRDFHELITEMAWGTWARPGLERKQRSLNVQCLLAALNRPVEFKLHFRAALGNGCTREELRETLLQITAYAGAPAGVEAFRIAREVFSDVHGA